MRTVEHGVSARARRRIELENRRRKWLGLGHVPSAGHFRQRFANFQRQRAPADPPNSVFRADTPVITTVSVECGGLRRRPGDRAGRTAPPLRRLLGELRFNRDSKTKRARSEANCAATVLRSWRSTETPRVVARLPPCISPSVTRLGRPSVGARAAAQCLEKVGLELPAKRLEGEARLQQ